MRDGPCLSGGILLINRLTASRMRWKEGSDGRLIDDDDTVLILSVFVLIFTWNTNARLYPEVIECYSVFRALLCGSLPYFYARYGMKGPIQTSF